MRCGSSVTHMQLAAALIVSIALYTAFQFTVAKTVGAINDVVASVLIGVGMPIIPALAWAVMRLSKTPLAPTTASGVVWAIVSGLIVGAFQIAIIPAFASGGAAFAVPVVYGATLALVALISWIALRQTPSVLTAIGVALIFVGVSTMTYARITAQP